MKKAKPKKQGFHFKHEDSPQCWCRPYLCDRSLTTDVWVHRDFEEVTN